MATEKARSAEALAWEQKYQLLGDLIDLKLKEIASLRASIDSIAANTTQADHVRAELVQKKDRLGVNRLDISQFLVQVEPRMLALKAWLPAPLKLQLRPLFQKIGQSDSMGTLGIAERMQAVVGLLQALNQFDQTVTVHNSLRTLESGQQIEVETVYLGLGMAYYRSFSGEFAGYGQPSSRGWVWHPQHDLAPAIAAALAVANNQVQAAEFIQLPVEIID